MLNKIKEKNSFIIKNIKNNNIIEKKKEKRVTLSFFGISWSERVTGRRESWTTLLKYLYYRRPRDM